MVKTSTYSPKVRPMNSKTINRNSVNSHEKASNSTSTATYSKSVDAKFFARAFDYSNTKLSPRDNSAVLRAVSASTSANHTASLATASRLNKYQYQPSYESHEMFEQQTPPQQQQESKQNTFGKYENNFSNSNGSVVVNSAHSADNGENNQMVVITLNGIAQQKQVNREFHHKISKHKKKKNKNTQCNMSLH